MDDTLMESLAPFDYSEAGDFQTAYLSGYLADRYDVTADENRERVNGRIKTSTEYDFRGTVSARYDTVIAENSSVRFSGGRTKYALFPVWILNTTWKGEKYTFAMNGQTGKFVGDLPIDKGRFWGWFGGLTAGITVVGYLLSWLLLM